MNNKKAYKLLLRLGECLLLIAGSMAALLWAIRTGIFSAGFVIAMLILFFLAGGIGAIVYFTFNNKEDGDE